MTCNYCGFVKECVLCEEDNKWKNLCKFDNNFYPQNHQCHFNLTPVIEGKWNQIDTWATKAKYQCSVCGRTIMSALKVNMEKYPYCHCGAKMSEGDVL